MYEVEAVVETVPDVLDPALHGQHPLHGHGIRHCHRDVVLLAQPVDVTATLADDGTRVSCLHQTSAQKSHAHFIILFIHF